MTVNDVIYTSEEIFRQLVGSKIRIITHLDQEAGNVLLARGALRRLLFELVCKAAEWMGDRGVLSIATERVVLNGDLLQDWREASAGDYVVTAITASRAYETGSARADTQPEFDISNALEMVRSSGGQLNLTTEHSRSITIRILLPRSDRRAETILLAGQHPEVRAHVRAMLLQEGYAVLEAVNAMHAEIICSHFGKNIDLVLLHRNIIGESRVFDWRPPLSDVPVITLPPDPAASTHDAAAASTGVHPLVQTPGTSEELLHKIRVVLEGIAVPESRPGCG